MFGLSQLSPISFADVKRYGTEAYTKAGECAGKIPRQAIPACILIGSSTVALVGKNYIAPVVGSVTGFAINTIVGCCGGPIGSVVGLAGSTICWLGCNTARSGITFMYSYAAKTMGSVSVWTYKHGPEFMKTSHPDPAFLESHGKVKDWSKTLKACRNTLFVLSATYFALHTLGLENAGAHLFPALPFAAKTLSRWAFFLGVGSTIASVWTDQVLKSVRVVPQPSTVVNTVTKAAVTCAVTNGSMSQEEVNSYSICPEHLIDPNIHVNAQQARHEALQVGLRDRVSRLTTLYMLEAMDPTKFARLVNVNFRNDDRTAAALSDDWVTEQRTLDIKDLWTFHNMLKAKSADEKRVLETELQAVDLDHLPVPTKTETNDQSMLRWLAYAAAEVGAKNKVQQGIHTALMTSRVAPKPLDWQQYGLSLLQM
ncbi:MAG: hypothetical protein Q8K75_07120 [Chlamydiales bacterium]|nr:hypothetical protein [Chlamydiales bacterium]